MGNESAWHRGLEAPPDDIKDTVRERSSQVEGWLLITAGMVKLIDEGDKEKIGGWTTRW